MLNYLSVVRAQEDFFEKRVRYLKEKGWKHSSKNIMATWFWEKEIEGKLYCMSAENAFDIQCTLDDIAE